MLAAQDRRGPIIVDGRVEQQAALRRVATDVARVTLSDVFQALIGEVGGLVAADASALTPYETDGTVALCCATTRASSVRERIPSLR